jgi:predicted nucleic acid-binding protein
MRIDRYISVLDACVLIPMPVADTLLRLAEEPSFYTPRWSEDILGEVRRSLCSKFGYSEKQATRRLTTMDAAFPEAMVTGYESLIDSMKNHPEDRHVLAVAVRCGAHAIVTNNQKDFPRESLEPFGLECVSADKFLEDQYHLNPDLFIRKLVEQALQIGWTLPQLIAKHVPSLARLIKTGYTSAW